MTAPAPAPTASGLPDATPASLETARHLLAHLAPLFPSIASATRTMPGAETWILAWARSITLAGLSQRQIERGLSRLARGELDPDIPLSWPAFYRLCRDLFLDANEPCSGAERERKMREFQARHPGARFVNRPAQKTDG